MKNLLKAIWFQYKFAGLSRNSLGIFYRTSHAKDDKPKVAYSTPESAQKASLAMHKKTGNTFSSYKCAYCDGYHIGKDRS